ncbi:MAG: M20/M25/M40 family metallo-hydrolase, partial [Anaerolineaceae bacterium]
YLSTLFGGRVRFTNGTNGVIGVEKPAFGKTLPEMSKFFIDVGATSRENCPVRPGDAAAFWRAFEDMGDRLAAKAMDDRIAVAISIEAMKQMGESPNEVYFVFTTQEEVGLRGAQTSAFGLDPDIGLAVDITDSFDTPNDHQIDIRMGKGPAIKVMDGYLVVDPRIVDWMGQAAERIGIPHQYEVLPFGGTDAGAISLVRAGVPSGCISIPTRYAHSPSEVLDYQDVLNAVKLLVELVSKPVELHER